MNEDLTYRLGIMLEASKIMVDATKRTSLRRTTAYHCRQAQSLRRQIREIA